MKTSIVLVLLRWTAFRLAISASEVGGKERRSFCCCTQKRMEVLLRSIVIKEIYMGMLMGLSFKEM